MAKLATRLLFILLVLALVIVSGCKEEAIEEPEVETATVEGGFIIKEIDTTPPIEEEIIEPTNTDTSQNLEASTLNELEENRERLEDIRDKNRRDNDNTNPENYEPEVPAEDDKVVPEDNETQPIEDNNNSDTNPESSDTTPPANDPFNEK